MPREDDAPHALFELAHVPRPGVLRPQLSIDDPQVWLVVVLTLPWNLHFQAKATLFDMQRARERGLAVKKDREDEARRVARRMLRVSLALHAGSAALAAVGAPLSKNPWGYLFSGAYLASGLFRPGVAYYKYLRTRLGHLAAEASFPRTT
jgi:hypothetical protein